VGDLVAQGRNGALQFRHLANERNHQRPQLGMRQRINISGQLHPGRESETPPAGKPACPDFFPCYVFLCQANADSVLQ
jgi:hypothetical protein